ncbi:MAG TPA: substrate-binding domain-containing protein [Trebonia sp.]|nr:substrate-binding domain-containing protein [Trebonia sp.]
MAIVVPIVVVAVAWLVLSVPRMRQISWRDQVDTPLDLLPKEARLTGAWAGWKVLVNQREVAQPSLVLLRVRNSGLGPIRVTGIRRPVTFTFPGRDVVEYAVTECRGGITWDMVAPPFGAPVAGHAGGTVVGNRIILPRFPMARRSGFKLLVLLTGDGQGVLGKGRLRGGQVVHETRRRSPRSRNLAFGTVLALLVGAQAGVALGEGPPIPSSCRSGQLVIQGSTAFQPVAQQVAQSYSGTCRDAAISVTGTGSFNGLTALSDSAEGAGGVALGAAAPSPSSAASSPAGSSSSALSSSALSSSALSSGATAVQIAMSDGPAPPGYHGLVRHPVAVIVFAVVVNKSTGVFNLTTAQLSGIFHGTITNWRQVGGASLPISIVARTSGSGTRNTFDTKVLGGASEPPASSFNCVSKNELPSSPVIRCEEPTTGTLLQRVNSIPGAIGYAQISDAASFLNVEPVKINASDPDIGDVKAGKYPYWTVEYLYTNGKPRAGSLIAAFLSYFGTDNAENLLLNAAYTPCGTTQPEVARLCAGR